MTRTRTSGSVLALGALLTLATAAPAVGADGLADGNGFVVGGQAVDLSVASGQGTKLAPGLYSATMPVDETPRYAEVQRGEGERLEVSVLGSATWKNNAWTVGSGSQGLSLRLETTDGKTSCGSTSDSVSTSSTPGLLATTVGVDEARTERMGGANSSSMPDECLKATSYRVQIQRTQDGDDATPMPVQIAVRRTPRVTGEVKTPSSTVEDMSTQALSASEKVEPGNGFANATTLKAGGYDVDAPLGRRMFFRVHLGWGQRMSVGWQLPKNGTSFTPPQDLQMKLAVYSPALVPATMSGSGSDSGYLFTSSSGGGEPEELGAFTAPIDYGNVNVSSSGSDAIQQQASPGWYYVALDITPSSSASSDTQLDTSKKIASVVSVRVTGTPNAGPTMAVQEPEPGTLSGVGTTSSNPFLWGGAMLLGIAAVGGLGYVLWKRTKHA